MNNIVKSYFEAAYRGTAHDKIFATCNFFKYSLLYNHFTKNLLLYAEYCETIFWHAWTPHYKYRWAAGRTGTMSTY